MGRKPQTEAEKQRKIDSILTTAQEMIMEKNYDGVKISDLASRTGIAKGTVFLYFQTKEDIFFQLFTDTIRSWFHAFATAIEHRIEDGAMLNVEIFLEELCESLLNFPHLPRIQVLLHSRIVPGLNTPQQYKDFQIQILDGGAELLESFFPYVEPGMGIEIFSRIMASLASLDSYKDIWMEVSGKLGLKLQDPIFTAEYSSQVDSGEIHALDFYIHTVRRVLKGYSIL